MANQYGPYDPRNQETSGSPQDDSSAGGWGQPGYGQQPASGQQPGYGQPLPGYGQPQGPYYGGQPADNRTAFAPWITRVGGYIIDVIPNLVLQSIAVAIHSSAVSVLMFLLSLGWTIYNRWYLGGTTGQSIGRRAVGIRLVSLNTGQPIGPLMAFVRDIAHFVDSVICLVGWLFPLWDAKRQTIADKIVSTVVVPANAPGGQGGW